MVSAVGVLKDHHVDAVLGLVLSGLVFFIGLAWNSVFDTIIQLYGGKDSLQLTILYAVVVSVLAFALGDYLINRLKLECYDDSYLHRMLKFVSDHDQDPNHTVLGYPVSVAIP
jgi:hypothetical protein